MHDVLTIGSPDVWGMTRNEGVPHALKKWAKNHIHRSKQRKAGDREYVIPKYHWEKLAAHFGVPPQPGLPVEAVAAFLGPEAVNITVTMLRNTNSNAWYEDSPTHAPAKDEVAAQAVRFTIERWNEMYPEHAIDVEAQKAAAGTGATEPEAFVCDY